MPLHSKEPQSPAENNLITPSEGHTMGIIDEKIKMKRHMGLLGGVAVILGIICGSGIFITPRGVIQEVDSVGFSLVMWVLCGLLSMIGALCYAELGTSIPKSGGDYAYIYEAFGPLPSFLYLWAANVIFVPTTNAIMGLTFAKYVIQPLFPACDMPDFGVRLVAAAVICFLSFLNGYSVKTTLNLQNVFMFCKIGALVLVILIGVTWMSLGHLENFSNAFQHTTTNPGKIANGFYSGIFSYSGWSYLNFMIEELQNPFVNLPRAIYISLPLVTVIYVLANMAYLSVLTPQEVAATDAVAVTFSNTALGPQYTWILSLLVAISAFGGLSVHIMTSSRMLYVGARNGHFPAMLSHLNVWTLTPVPSLAFLNIISIAMLCTSNIQLLIKYCTIVESFFVTVSVSGLLFLRWKKPDMDRPIKLNLAIPIAFVIICIFLLVLPIIESPLVLLWGAVITLSGVPVYFFGIKKAGQPKSFGNFMNKATVVCQKLFAAAHEDVDEEF
ncbi:Y+L amino acid transporter 2 [Cylas formicarius]|uniref:Y+L amino acid transporter 2 n=1 Tax=Cylas formicarius TaxID=197179 RepID=UPI002958B573|nr:Y+L amino acid transporter 2 [Cylas formicarius]